MSPIQRWNQTALHNQILVVTAAIGTIFTLANLGLVYLQFRTAEHDSALDQRPWVTVKSMSFDVPIKEGQKPIIKVTWANSGKTPALRMKAVGTAFVEKTDAAPYTDLPPLQSGYLLGPGVESEVSVTVHDPLTKAQIDAIHAGTQSIYVLMNSIYTDVFGGVHHSQMSGFITKDGLETGEMAGSDFGNDAD